jgi:hypothetical protein
VTAAAFAAARFLFVPSELWLGWAYLTKKMPHNATTPIATAFKTCIRHRKKGLWLNRLPEKVRFPIFD